MRNKEKGRTIETKREMRYILQQPTTRGRRWERAIQRDECIMEERNAGSKIHSHVLHSCVQGIFRRIFGERVICEKSEKNAVYQAKN